jgi:hypothetical protein
LHQFQSFRFATVHCSQLYLNNSRLHGNSIAQGDQKNKLSISLEPSSKLPVSVF